jgi:hypothetical protein
MPRLPELMKTVRMAMTLVVVLCVAACAMTKSSATAKIVGMRMKLRTWTHPFKNSSEWTAATFEHTIPPSQTAIIICDMWISTGAEERQRGCRISPGEWSQSSNGRAHSILIIHAPSETMPYYTNTPGRLLAERAVTRQAPN